MFAGPYGQGHVVEDVIAVADEIDGVHAQDGSGGGGGVDHSAARPMRWSVADGVRNVAKAWVPREVMRQHFSRSAIR
ncbi:hypothetical protein GCM10022284_64190 [Streptomyces hundungensis]